VNGLHVVDQVWTGLEEARLGLCRHLVAQAQRPLDGDACVTVVGIVENLTALTVFHSTVEPHDMLEQFGVDVAALVTKHTLALLSSTCCPEIASVEKLNLTLPPLFLTIRDNPDVGTDASVIKHLLGKSDDRLEPIILDDPFANFALAGPRATGKERRPREDDGQARAVL